MTAIVLSLGRCQGEYPTAGLDHSLLAESAHRSLAVPNTAAADVAAAGVAGVVEVAGGVAAVVAVGAVGTGPKTAAVVSAGALAEQLAAPAAAVVHTELHRSS